MGAIMLGARSRMATLRLLLSCALAIAAGLPAAAGEWPSWRGPHSNNISDEKGLPSRWTRSGENLIWRADWVGRSTPAVFDGRVCASGRKDQRYEVVACWSAQDGRKLWERQF